MITYSIIQKSQLEGAHRLDAEYFQPEYLEIEKKLKQLKSKSLDEISNSIVSFGAYALTSFIEWQKEGIPFIVAENVKEGFLDLDSARFISEEVDEILKKSRVKEGQVLLSMSGSVGNAAIAHQVPQNLNSNQDIAKITLKKDFSPYYLTIFLNSKYGKEQVLRLPVGSVQQHIFLWQTKSLLIPQFPDVFVKQVEDIYREASKQLNASKDFYLQAEDLFLEELGLKDFEVEDDLSFVVNLSDVKAANCADAEYFQPKYDKLLERIKQNNSQVLTSIIENVSAKFDPGKTPDAQFHYVELANINSSIGVINGYTKVLGEEAPSRAKRVLKKGDVIVSSIEGSLEKIALADDEQDGYIASTGFFQFRSKELLPEVILILAKSIVLQWQLKQYCTGTILTAVPSESLQKMFIPTISKPTQEKIADLVKKSHEARKKSKKLLEEAKRKVEAMIEKGGES